MIFYSLVLISFVAHVVSAAGTCPVPNALCIYGEPDPSGKTVYTVHAAGGWVGFGTGSRMAQSNMFILWANSSGGAVISPRTSSGHSVPAYSAQIAVSTTDLKVPAPAWAKLSVSFVANTFPGTTWNWGVGRTAPTSNDPASTFAKHSNFGTMNVNFATAVATGAGNNGGNPPAGLAPPAAGAGNATTTPNANNGTTTPPNNGVTNPPNAATPPAKTDNDDGAKKKAKKAKKAKKD